MKKIFLILLLVFFIIPTYSSAETSNHLKAAFIRGDDLWLKLGEKEVKLTNGEYVRFPKWSYDGSLVAYMKGAQKSDNPLFDGELWLYNLKFKKHFKVASKVNNEFQWSPTENKIGFIVEKTLYAYSMESTLPSKVTTNIENFSWLPDGSGFLTSAKESAQLDSDLILSNITLSANFDKPKISQFYTVPVNDNEYFVSTSPFKWSADKKWISFLLVPTASLSADGNTLCILSSDRKTFQRTGEMLKYNEWFQWAPSKSVLGYISGVGREATSNKQLKLVSVPNFMKKMITPTGYVDRDLVWASNHLLYVSRSKESKWIALNKRPLPSLYTVNRKTNGQKRITFPSKQEGDFRPQVFHHQLVWIRTDSKTTNVLVTPTHHIKEKIWIKNIDTSSPYYDRWNWDEVFYLFGAN